MKKALSFLAVCMVATFAQAAPPFEHAQTGITLPDTLAGLVRDEARPYENPPGEPGVAIPYNNEKVAVTIFIRQINRKQVASPALIVNESLATVKQMKTYTDVKLYAGTTDSEAPGWAKGAFSARTDQGDLISYIHATLKGDYVIKVRISVTDPKLDTPQQFMREFQKIVQAAKPRP